jgi:hypothetical protein
VTPDLRRSLALALGALALFVLAAAGGYFTEGDEPPGASVAPPEEAAPAARGGIQSFSGDTLLLLTESGHKPFQIGPGTTIEIAQPVPASALAEGDWLNIGAQRNDQSVFTIVGLTLIPQSQLKSP